jgi:iron complex outermembrane receptor protein
MACLLFTAGGALAFAAGPATVQGSVIDPAGNLISGAQVTLTNIATGSALTALTGQDGTYSISVSSGGAYTLTIRKEGFNSFSQPVQLQPNQFLHVDAKLAVGTASQSVVVHGGVLPGATEQPSQEQVFLSSQSIRVIDRKQMDIVGPVAGAAQIISTTPGANVTGYGNTGATKYTVTLNGINQGWGGYGGFTGGGSLAVTFDNVPIVDPGTGLWQSPTLPQTQMIQNVNVTYGPGNPADRWYTNIGGAVEFTPVQPTAKPHADLSLIYGSYDQKNIETNLSTGQLHGWSAVFSGGAGSGNDFRKAPDGFKNPSKDIAALGKVVKAFDASSLELAGYYAHGGGYRSQVIPTTANPGITVNGEPGTEEYSQPTSGYYSTLPYNSYNKYDTNEMGLIYARENVQMDDTTSLQNLSWYMHIARSHYRIDDVYSPGPQQDEWNSPYTNTVGDKFTLTKLLPYNTVTADGYYLHALYNSRNNFYNPADGGAKRVVNIGGKIRSSYFDQDDFALSLQDDIHPVPILHITPGIRYVGFATGYSNAALQDFTFVPGVVLSSHCPANQTSNSSDPTVNTKDQGANCPGHENRSGVEPSVDVTVRVLPWLSLYGGFYEALRSPQLGGGGGQFQAVDPASYHLSRQTYYQAGLKVHLEQAGIFNNLLFGAAFYHQNYADQEIDVTLANGNSVSSNGTSAYHGVNAFIDDDPVRNLHAFANISLEAANYTNYVVILPLPATSGSPATPGQNYNGSPVPYVPTSTLNVGVYYDWKPSESVMIEPMASFQFIGSQHLFDNVAVAPSNQTMSSYGTLNLGVKAPIKKHVEANLTALNVLNKKYNEYEYISSGGYFGTPSGGYRLAYPAPPVTVYGGVDFHF